MKVFLYTVALLAALVGFVHCDSELVESMKPKFWRQVTNKYPHYGTMIKFKDVDCDAVNTEGNTTCLACIVLKWVENPRVGTGCVSITPRLEYREVYVEVFNLNKITSMQEILQLKTSTPRKMREGANVMQHFGKLAIRTYPVNIVQSLNGKHSLKFCIDAVFGEASLGGRWCFLYDGNRLNTFSTPRLLLGEGDDPAGYEAVKFNSHGVWVQKPFDEILP